MSIADKIFASSIPEIYDAYLVPLIFESYAVDLAARACETAPKTILETAAGRGIVPRALSPLLSATARYIVNDLNQPMVDRAVARQAHDAPIDWRHRDLFLPRASAAKHTL